MSDALPSVVDAANEAATFNPDSVFVQYGSLLFAILVDWSTGSNIFAYSAPAVTTEHEFVVLANVTIEPGVNDNLAAYLLSEDPSVVWTHEDPGNAPTTESPFGFIIDGPLIRILVTDQATNELLLYTFDMDTKLWSLTSASGIITGPGSFMFGDKDQTSGEYVFYYYTGSSAAWYVRYDPVGGSWGTPVSAPETARMFFIDSTGIIHIIYQRGPNFPDPMSVKHRAFVNDIAQTEQNVFTAIAYGFPNTLICGYPMMEWNGKITFTFLRWLSANNQFIVTAIAYANAGEGEPTWTLSNPTPQTPHRAQSGTYGMQLLPDGKIAPVWGSLSPFSGPDTFRNNVYFRGFSTGLAWDADDTLFYDYWAHPPNPNSPFIFDNRVINHLMSAFSSGVGPTPPPSALPLAWVGYRSPFHSGVSR